MIRRSARASAVRPSQAVAWLAILAFLLQGLIVQSHIHVASLESSAIAHPVQAGQGPSNKTPDKAPADCPACQLQAATAAFVLSPPAALLTLITWVAAGSVSLPSIRIHTAPLRSWSSRAPPQR